MQADSQPWPVRHPICMRKVRYLIALAIVVVIVVAIFAVYLAHHR